MKKMKRKNHKIKKNVATGTLRVHQRGFGFLVPEDKVLFPRDIFIPKQAIRQAVDGDIVEVIVSPVSLSDKGPEGKVSRILRRGRTHVNGIVEDLLHKNEVIALAPTLGGKTEIRVHTRGKRLKIGDRITIHMTDWDAGYGEMTGFIGNIADPSKDVQAAMIEYDLHAEFPQEVILEAKNFGTKVDASEIKGRLDLRGLECFTIDPETAKDFDDAISLEKDTQGNFLLGVHIADVSHYVRPLSALDKEAEERCNSVYFPGSVVPMLPHELSSHLCSLKQNVNRLTASVLITFDTQGNVIHYDITRSIIRSRKRFSYPEAFEVLEKKRESPHFHKLVLMVELCGLLKKKRYERGCIEFSFPEVKILSDDKGIPYKLELLPYDVTHQLVEEFMLKANEIVATHIAKQDKSLPFRIHDEPKIENMKDFAELARTLGYTLSDNPTSEELQKLFEETRDTALGQFLATAFIRSMKLATYSTENVGHYGLGLEYYCHFTSPIRRYVDLVVHRILFNESNLSEEDIDDIALKCSEKERLSAKAENGVIHLKKLRLLSKLYAENPARKYEAVITAIKPFGFVFEIPDFLIDGFIFLDELEGNEFYFFDEKKKRLVTSKGTKKFLMGDRIQVFLKEIDLITQETKWALVNKKIK